MNSTVLQVPIKKNVRDQATSAAEKMGFSSLQEVVRLFLNKMASGQIDVNFESQVSLSDKNDVRYSQMIEDVDRGKIKPKVFTNTNSLIEYLQSED